MMTSKDRKSDFAGGQHEAVIPSNWPPTITYLKYPRYASDLTPQVLEKVRGASAPPSRKPSLQSLPQTKLIKIQQITSPTHPANGQRGLFAAHKISPNTHILDYFGEVHTDERPNSDYDLCLTRFRFSDDDVVSVGIDAQFMGNEARFINDYRGTGVAKPNAEFRERLCEDGEMRMSVWSSSKGIRKGEEILVSYGKGWWKARDENGIQTET